MHLVVNTDVYVLLARWDDLSLLLTLQRRQLLDGLLDDAEGSLDLVFADDERWCQTDDVLMRGLGQ